MIEFFAEQEGEVLRQTGGPQSQTFISLNLAIQVLRSYSDEVAFYLSSIYIEALNGVEKQGDSIMKLDRKYQGLLKKRTLPKLDGGACIYLCGNVSMNKYKIGQSQEINKTLAVYRRLDDQVLLFFLVYIPLADLNLVEKSFQRSLEPFKSTLNHEQVKGISPQKIFSDLKSILISLRVEGRCASLETLNSLNSQILNTDLSKSNLEDFIISESLLTEFD